MKKIILLSFLTFLISSTYIYSQTGELTIEQINNGSTIDVSVYLKNTSEVSWSLGFASLVFNFNSSAMINPIEVAEGQWDNNSNPDYADQIVAVYGGGTSASIELGLNALPVPGTVVPGSPSITGIIRFNITDPSQFHNITWNTAFSAVLDNNGSNITNGITFINPPNEPLPVELVSFTAMLRNSDIELNWTTTQEINNSGFQLERKKDESGWQSISFINGMGNSNERKDYSFTDKNLKAGKYNYRLKQIDFNGNFKYYNLQTDITIGLPDKFELSQNYPNPFNPETILRFSIPKLSKVKLSVYDITGREISKLVDSELTPGSYEYVWNASDFSSGIYLYKLEAAEFTETKRMTLLK